MIQQGLPLSIEFLKNVKYLSFWILTKNYTISEIFVSIHGSMKVDRIAD